MTKIKLLLAVVVLLVGIIIALRAQSNTAPQWYKGSRADFTDTIVYQTQSDFGGMHFEASIYGRDLDHSPKWLPGKKLPTDIPTIIADAEDSFRKAFPDFKEFKIVSVDLVHLPAVDDWVFDLNFNGTDFSQPGGISFEDKKINVLASLNGQVFMPTESAK